MLTLCLRDLKSIDVESLKNSNAGENDVSNNDTTIIIKQIHEFKSTENAHTVKGEKVKSDIIQNKEQEVVNNQNNQEKLNFFTKDS